MAEAQKKDPYKILFEAMAESGLNDEELKKHFPKAMNLWESGASEKDRRKAMEAMLGDPEFQKELRLWDELADYDFSGYEKPKNNVKPGNLSGADMNDVEKFYDKAKQIIDPKGRLGKTELYDTAGPSTFEQLEEKIGPDYEGDWFGNLLKAFNYPDTPEGMEQLTQDFQTALTRMKNRNFADKFGSAKTPLKFAFGKTFEALEDGKKPGLGDVAVDAGTNALWAITPTKFIPLVGKAASKLPKAAEIIAKADAPKTMIGKMIKGVSTNAVAPAFRNFGDYAFGTDTEKEKNEGLLGRAMETARGTGVNLVTPGLANRVVPFLGNMLGRLNLAPKEMQYGLQKISDFLYYGNKQTAAKERLNELVGATSRAKDAARLMSKILAGKGNLNKETLGKAIADLPGVLQEDGRILAGMIANNGMKLGKGVKDFVSSRANDILKSELQETANKFETVWDAVAPYMSSYLVNRAGTEEVADYMNNLIGRRIGRFVDNDQ